MSRDRRVLRRFGPIGLIALMAAASPPSATPGVSRYAIAGITPGMSLASAIAEMHQTFAREGLTDVHAVSVNAQMANGGRVRRLTIDQSASSPPSGEQYYHEDHFRLRLAGAPGEERVTSITRDYLAPVGLARQSVIDRLEKNFGRPSNANIPAADVAPNSAVLTWMVGSSGTQVGGGSQSSRELVCSSGMLNYFDAFDNAGNSNDAILRLLQEQKSHGCSLVIQVSLAYDAIHFEAYDVLSALNALGSSMAERAPAENTNKVMSHSEKSNNADVGIRY